MNGRRFGQLRHLLHLPSWSPRDEESFLYCLGEARARDVVGYTECWLPYIESFDVATSRVYRVPHCESLAHRAELMPFARFHLDWLVPLSPGAVQDLTPLRHVSAMTQVVSLSLDGLSLNATRAAPVWQSLLLVGVKTLSLRINALNDEAMMMLSEAASLHNVTALDLGHNNVSCAGLRRLLTSPVFAQLKVLELGSNWVAATDVWRDMPPTRCDLDVLGLSFNRLGDEWDELFAEFVGAPWLASLRSLDLTGNALNDEDASALAHSPMLGSLLLLVLDDTTITSTGYGALANSRYLCEALRQRFAQVALEVGC